MDVLYTHVFLAHPLQRFLIKVNSIVKTHNIKLSLMSCSLKNVSLIKFGIQSTVLLILIPEKTVMYKSKLYLTS